MPLLNPDAKSAMYALDCFSAKEILKLILKRLNTGYHPPLEHPLHKHKE